MVDHDLQQEAPRKFIGSGEDIPFGQELKDLTSNEETEDENDYALN